MWMLLTLIFTASIVLAVGSSIFCTFRYGQRSFEVRLCLLSLAYLLLTYVAGFISVCWHPYWIDNQAEKFIPLSERWIWAFLGASVFEFVLCPLLVVGYAILRSHHTRILRSSRVPNTT